MNDNDQTTLNVCDGLMASLYMNCYLQFHSEYTTNEMVLDTHAATCRRSRYCLYPIHACEAQLISSRIVIGNWLG